MNEASSSACTSLNEKNNCGDQHSIINEDNLKPISSLNVVFCVYFLYFFPQQVVVFSFTQWTQCHLITVYLQLSGVHLFPWDCKSCPCV